MHVYFSRLIPLSYCPSFFSLSAQVIQRGTRSAGYGFVAFSTIEAAEKAVAALDKKELDGRTVIIEIAKPTEQKDKERTERRAKRRAGRRGSKAPPGEVTEAEANGEADKAEGAAPADGAAKPKKKRNLVCVLPLSPLTPNSLVSIVAEEGQEGWQGRWRHRSRG